MTRNQKLWMLGGAIVLLVIGIKFFPSHCSCSGEGLKVETISLGDTNIKVEVADTDASREQGLSDRTSLADGSGMLFVFDTPDIYGFWMKDMNFALDMVWVDADNQIIKVDNSLATSTYPSVFYPPRAVKYVIELPAGYSLAHDIIVGKSLSIEH